MMSVRMEVHEIQEALSNLDSLLSAKNYTIPECQIDISTRDATVWVKAGRSGQTDHIWECVSGDTFGEVFGAAEEYIEKLEDMDDFKKKKAVQQFGRAVDSLREAGIEAKFVDPLSDALKAMTENLLEHHSTPTA